MFTSFDEKLFYKAINEKDFIRLKTNTVSAIRNDPTFSGKKDGEIGQLLRILHDKTPEIFEEEKDLGYEEHLDEALWDSRYFTRLTFWFQENFSEKRLAEIETVGKKVFASETKKPALPPTQAPKRNETRLSRLLTLIGVILGILALVLVLIKFLPGLNR